MFVVFLVRGIRAFTARTHELLEVGDIVKRHLEDRWLVGLVVGWQLDDGNDGGLAVQWAVLISPLFGTPLAHPLTHGPAPLGVSVIR